MVGNGFTPEASGGGGASDGFGLQFQPDVLGNHKYINPYNTKSLTGTTNSSSSSFIRLVPIPLPNYETLTVAKLHVFNLFSDATTSAVVGIWDSNGHGQPSDLLWSGSYPAGTFSPNGNQFLNPALSLTGKKLIWTGISVSASISLLSYRSSAAGDGTFLYTMGYGFTGATIDKPASCIEIAHTYDGTLPDPISLSGDPYEVGEAPTVYLEFST